MFGGLKSIAYSKRVDHQRKTQSEGHIRVPIPFRALYFDLDGVLVNKPVSGHNRLDYARLQNLQDWSLAYRQDAYGEDPELTLKKHRSVWKMHDPFNIDSTDLSYVLSLLQKDFRPQLADHRLHTVARELIVRADHEHDTLRAKLPHGERYEHDPQIVEFVHRLYRRYPDVPFLVNSGNSKARAEEKIVGLGLQEVFMREGALPDYPVYGEDMMGRREGIEWIKKNVLQERAGSEVLFCDRPADPFALRIGWDKNDYYMYFNERPDLSHISYTRPTIASALKEADAGGRVCYLPSDMEPAQKVQRLEYALHVDHIAHSPEHLAGMRK